MDPVGKILGNGMECVVCGSMKAKRKYPIPLTHYGKRVVEPVVACEACIKLQKKGEL